MTDATVPSPDGLELRSKPLASARLSKKAVFGVIGALALIMGVVIVNVSKGKTVKAAEATTKEFQPDLIDAKDLNDRVVDFPAPEPIKMPEPEEQPAAKPVGKSRDEDARWADTPVVKFSDKEKTDERGVMAAQAVEGGAPEDDPVQTATEGGAASGSRGRARRAMHWGAAPDTPLALETRERSVRGVGGSAPMHRPAGTAARPRSGATFSRGLYRIIFRGTTLHRLGGHHATLIRLLLVGELHHRRVSPTGILVPAFPNGFGCRLLLRLRHLDRLGCRKIHDAVIQVLGVDEVGLELLGGGFRGFNRLTLRHVDNDDTHDEGERTDDTEHRLLAQARARQRLAT